MASLTASSLRPDLTASSLRPDLTCAVCRDLLYRPVVTTCGHAFCQSCLVQMATALRRPSREHQTTGADKFSCPYCRADLELRCVRSKVCAPLSNVLARVFLEPGGVADPAMAQWAASRAEEWARASVKFEKWWAAYGTWDSSMDRTAAEIAEIARIGAHPHLCRLASRPSPGVRAVVARQAEWYGDRSIRQHVVVDDGEADGRMRLTLTIEDFPRTVRDATPFRVAIAALQMQEDEVSAGGAPPMVGDDERTMVRAGAGALGSVSLTLILEEVVSVEEVQGLPEPFETKTRVCSLSAALRRGVAKFGPITIPKSPSICDDDDDPALAALRAVAVPTTRRFRITVYVDDDAALAMAIEFNCIEKTKTRRGEEEEEEEEEMNASWSIRPDGESDEEGEDDEDDADASDDSFIVNEDEDEDEVEESGGGTVQLRDRTDDSIDVSALFPQQSDFEEEQHGGSDDDAAVAEDRDSCAVCGNGGTLVLCDGCPRVYHGRCVHRPSASAEMLDDGGSDDEWLCPQCCGGGGGGGGGATRTAPPRKRQRRNTAVSDSSDDDDG